MKDTRENARSESDMAPIEKAILVTVPWLVGGLLVSLPLLLVDIRSDPLRGFIVQLSGLVLFGIVLSQMVVSLGSSGWFNGSGWGNITETVASGVALVVLVTGTVGLVTLASSAAMRFDPSTQFLQLISALDIAWVVAAVTIGAYRAWGRGPAVVGGLAIGLVCVWSIGRYLHNVGFGPNGEWVVSSSDLMRLVLPYDVAAALVATAVFTFGVVASVRGAAHVIEQPSPQS